MSPLSQQSGVAVAGFNAMHTGNGSQLPLSGPGLEIHPADGSFVRDAQSFIIQSCERLVSHLGVYNIWIALINEGRVTALASSFEDGFAPLRERMLGGWHPQCLDAAVQAAEISVISDVQEECGDCPLSGKYRGRVGLACRIASGDQIFGVLRVSAPAYMAEDEKVHGQLVESASQIGDILRQFHERDRMESELRESRRRLSSLMANLPGMAYRCLNDANWTMEFVSEGCLDLTGYARADLEQNRRLSYADLIHPDDRALVEKAVLAGVQSGEAFTMEYRIIDAAGRERWVWERGRVAGAGPDGMIMLEGFITDITERLHMQKRMQHAAKQESLALMAGGVAHDFNNILASILGNAENAMAGVDEDSEPFASLAQIVKSAHRAAGLCRQMLNFCGRAHGEPEPIDLSALLEGMKPLLKSVLPRNTNLTCQLAEALPVFLGDPSEIRQIILQLTANAAESYGGRGGEIHVVSSVLTWDGRPLNGHMMASHQPPEGTYVCLAVTDHGCGMDVATRERMFDPFFSGKFTGRGLGLSSVLGIVQALNGRILVASSPGRGTAMKVLFPVAKEVAERASPPSVPPPPGPASPAPAIIKTVLLADDELQLTAVCAMMLKREKCRTIIAHNGLEAVEKYKQHRDEIDLVILDLTMPKLNGIEAYQQIRAINPGVRVAFATGYSAEDISSRVDVAQLVGILLKPFSRAELRALLEAAAK